MQHPSRIQKKLQQQTLRNIFIIFALLVLLVVFFFYYGLPWLINFTLLIGKNKESSLPEHTDSNSYVAPPMINPLFSATNSAKMTVSGYSLGNYSVKLYINGRLAGKQSVSDDKSFVFKNVDLHEGNNDIKAKAITPDGKESDYSKIITVLFENKAPSLSVDFPSDNQTFSNSDNPIKVAGKTDSGVKITVNDFWAIVDDDGKFSYILHLNNGDNHLKIVATDDAGNQTTKELKVTLNQ